MNKKKIITIILVLLVIILGGASIYVATQLSTRKAVAPTAPESKPKASETDEEVDNGVVYRWVGSEDCTVTGVATAVDVPKTCTDGPAMSDNFTGNVIDTNKWFVDNAGAGNDIRQVNGNIIVSRTSTAERGGVALISAPIDGDFDVQVDIVEATITSTVGNYGSIDLIAWEVDSDNRFGVRLMKDQGNDFTADYYSWKAGVEGSGIKNNMTSSTTKLYMQRRGQVMEGFAMKGDSKVSLGTTTMNFTKPIKFSIGSWSTSPAVTSAVLDNFVVSCECTPTAVITCDPDCPTVCGKAASTISTCTNSCGAATTKACLATAACEKVELEGSKTAYKNVASNTPGVYTLSSLMEFVSKSQIYVYTIELKNISETTASGVVVKDSLADMPVTFMDTVAGCTYSATGLELTCNTSIEPNATKQLSFRVKASDGIANGTVISNTGRVTYPDGSLDVTKDLTASSIVGCNHTCTTIEECSAGLTCDTTTSKCRIATCLTEDDCNCPSAVVPTTTRTSGTTTVAPTRVVTTIGEEPPTGEAIAKTTPTILPETGIFDLPGIAAFGGGLFLAIIGILLAL